MTEQLTEERISEFREAFEMFDKDKDGYITIKELGEIMKNLGHGPTEQEVNDMVNEVDVDGNGNIDFKEFIGLIARKLRDVDNDDELIESFKLIDRDGTGKISGPELKFLISTLGETISDEEIDEMIREADLDGDGEINYEEFSKIMLNKN
jgi:calmodulin